MAPDYNINAGRFFLTRGIVRAFSIDYRTLALFRVLLGVLILVDLALRSRDFTAFFTDEGVVTRKQALLWWGDGTWSLYFVNGSGVFAAALVAVAAIAACCLVAGYRTRWATVISWIMLVSLHHRTSVLSSGADDLMRVLAFWAIFLPLGARSSIDAALEKATPYPAQAHFSLATIAILMQAMYVYWVGALLKTGGPWTEDYSAVYVALNAEHYATSLGMWVEATFPTLLPLLTRFVYTIELFGPLLMLAPVLLLWLRVPTMLLLIAMHIGFALLLNVGHFPFVSITSLLLFTPPEAWRWLKRHWSDARSEGIRVYYDQDCEFCLKTVHILQQLLVLPNITVQPAQPDPVAGPLLEEHDSWVVMKPDGSTLLEWPALAWLMGRSPWGGWLSYPLRLLNLGGIGNRLYHLIGDNRRPLGRLSRRYLPWRETEPSRYLNHAVQALVGVAAVFVLYINLQPVLPAYLPEQGDRVKLVKYSTGLWQQWNMFAPTPMTWTQWPIYQGETADGRPVDLFRHEWGNPGFGKPEHVLALYDNHRWRKYNSRIYLRRLSYLRQSFIEFECAQWNSDDRPAEDRIARVYLAMANERTLADKSQESTLIEKLGTYDCPAPSFFAP